jgi:hypothetical protein
MSKAKSVEINAREVLLMFAGLDSRRQAKAHKKALQKGASILVRETRKNFKSVVKDPNSTGWFTRHKNSKAKPAPLSSGIRYSFRNAGRRDTTQVKVHIMGDFRLKWFELGTVHRYRGAKKKVRFSAFRKRAKTISTGAIKPAYFFQRARESKEKEIENSMERILAESIKKVYEGK